MSKPKSMPIDKLEIITTGSIQQYTTLLQSGVLYRVEYGLPIEEFLSALPGFDNNYINEEIQTLFLNGNPVDSLSTALTEETMTLALSAAMPGLAGAIFKKNSPHASLRTTPLSSQQNKEFETVSVTLKLFNKIAIDRGPSLLKKGCMLKIESFMKYISNRPSLQSSIQQLTLAGEPLLLEQLPEVITKKTYLYLSIKETKTQD